MTEATENTNSATPESTASYAQNYQSLKSVAETLRRGEVDIDALVPMVENAVASYKACKDRIKVVQEMLGQTLASELQNI